MAAAVVAAAAAAVFLLAAAGASVADEDEEDECSASGETLGDDDVDPALFKAEIPSADVAEATGG